MECASLKRDQCLVEDECAADYGPSVCGDRVCTDDIVFKRCRDASPEEMFKRKKIRQTQKGEEKQCGNSGGEWSPPNPKKDRRWGRCRCRKGTFFTKGKGCTSFKALCQEAGGTFYPWGKFDCNDKWREKYPHYCPKKFTMGWRHNQGELCLCGNRRPWDRDREKECPSK